MSIRLAAVTGSGAVSWLITGLSQESRDIEAEIREIRQKRRELITFSWRESLRDELADVIQSCSTAGWDGYDAEPVSAESEIAALQLIESLPEYILSPDVVPEPSGGIALEWRTDDRKHFTLSVSGTSLVYAGVFGGSCKKYGEEPFFDVLPATIVAILTHYFPSA